MPQEIDEPTLTAYALGELDGSDRAAERAALESRLTGDALARRQVEEIRATAQWVSAELAAEVAPGLSELQHAAIERRLELIGDLASAGPASLPMRPARRNWAFWGSLAASIVIVCTVMASVLPRIYHPGGDGRPGGGGVANPGDTAGPSFVQNPEALTSPRDASRPAMAEEGYAQSDSAFPSANPPNIRGENGFVRVADFPVSSVPATSTYSNAAERGSVASIRRCLANGQLPPPEAVQTDEIVNSLPYHYPGPKTDEAIGASLEVAGCPWDTSHRLLRIGLSNPTKAPALALSNGPDTNPATIPSAPARDIAGVKVSVEFNPAMAAAYRLIGYETGLGGPGDGSTDIRPTGYPAAGQSLTALYEVIPAGTVGPAAPLPPPTLKYQKLTPVAETSRELATVTVRFRRESRSVEAAQNLEFPVTDDGRPFAGAGEDFRTAAGAAALGLVLRSSPYRGTATYDLVIDTLGPAIDDRAVERAALLDLAKKAKAVADRTEGKP